MSYLKINCKNSWQYYDTENIRSEYGNLNLKDAFEKANEIYKTYAKV